MDRDAGKLVPSLEPMERDADVLWRTVKLVQERLPRGWSCRIAGSEVELAPGHRADALIEVRSPDARHATLVAEIRRVVVTRDLSHVVAQLRTLISLHDELLVSLHDEPLVPLVVARYLSSSARSWLTEREVSYADATGNLRIAVDNPGLYIRDTGADRDPWRGPGRPRGTLHGEPAARVVRALVDYRPPMSIPTLVKVSGASTGATYRVVDFLEEEALIERPKRGQITNVAWRPLLKRWSRDYSFQGTNAVGRFLQPRGIPGLLDSLREVTGMRYAVTGSLAAHQWASYAPARLATIYVDNIPQFAPSVDLRMVDSGANVLLASAKYHVVFDRTQRADGVTFAAPSQAAVDLLTGPGRNPAEAEMLMDWMEEHEREWRR
jgi:hypothetical protein